MIHEVSGDILLSQAEAIAHGVSPGEHFNQGLALALRERWPSLARDYKHWSHNSHPKPGSIWIWSGVGNTRIICMITQDDGNAHGHRNHAGASHIEYINHTLKELRKLVEKEGLTSLALPKLATGSGRLAWSDVSPLIQHHLGDLNIPIYLYTEYQSGKAAEELEVANR